MKAVVCKELCEPQNLTLEEVSLPPLTSGQIRIKVAACGVNFADTLIIAGKYQTKPLLPFIPGMEVAGTVLECSPDVRRCYPGDRVLALLDYGGFAEEAIATEADTFLLPDSMDFIVAAGFAVAYSTSEIALVLAARLLPGESLVVYGAAGGVGLTAVEIGKAVGATVIAIASGTNRLAIAADRGADYLIDHKTEDISKRIKQLTKDRGADVIYDVVGGSAFDTSLRSVAWQGRILIIGFASGIVPQIPANILLVKNVSAIGVNWGSYRKYNQALLTTSFSRLFKWYSQGKLRPHISATWNLAEAPSALNELRNRTTIGKVVLVT
jgi:NADPH2:quinone reductase